MHITPWLLSLTLVLTAHAAPAQTVIPAKAMQAVPQLRERALADKTAWNLVESLTTQVGPRLAGSEADARAVEWAKAKFKALGYDKVWTEPVTFPRWVRRSEHGAVLGPHAQPLVLTALGMSAGGTVEGEVVRFENLDALNAAPAGSLNGKIAFIDYAMRRTRDGSDYGPTGLIRRNGPSAAIRKGAAAFLMRSASTSTARAPHTGTTRYEQGLTPIPAAALAIADAEQLTRLSALGPTRVRIALDVGVDGRYTSHNVIGEITGSQTPDQRILIGGHLDSWDLGTGAIDDASGIGITMATGALLKPLKPRRTIRVVAFANEEQGLLGARAYADAHADEITGHVIGAESDFGAGRIYAFDSSARDLHPQAMQQISQALQPLGIQWMPGKGSPGPDIIPMSQRGMAWGWLAQDGTHYFDLHHNAEDTLDKVNPDDLAQNVAAYAVFTWLTAQANGDFGSRPKSPKPLD